MHAPKSVVLAIAAAFLLLTLGGCLDDSGSASYKKVAGGKAAGAAPELPKPITAVTPIAPNVLVSPAGHRMAEFMVARNPLDANHLILAAHDYDHLGTGTLSCVLYVSRDGGASWKQSNPIPGLNRPHLQFDGWVSFDMSGVAHFVCLDYDRFNPAPQTWAYYSNSDDGGMTWKPATVVQPMGGCDKTSLHAARDGRVYLMCSSRITRTDDGGKTWLPVVPGDGGGANGFAEDNLGTLYVMTRGGVSRSFDRGDTWKRVPVGPFRVPTGYDDTTRWVRQEPWTTLPSLAISPVTQHVFVAQQSWSTAKNAFEATVYVSENSGTNYTVASVPLFKSATCQGCSVTKPSVHVDDAGRLGLLVQLVNDGGHVKEVMFTASSDEGKTWVEPVVLSKTAPPNGWANPRTFTPNAAGAATLATYLAGNPTDAPNVAVGVALTTAVQELQMRWNGEYWGLSSSPNGFVVPWIDHSNNGAPQVFSRLVAAE
ncbi:MAG TPA: sialidase family protein [Candidatus Thermoplasmatota archaeon]|nr:sialidase family protein [Candidatus Thermoplasmatota archaeon]